MPRRIRPECTCGTWDRLHEPHCDRRTRDFIENDEFDDAVDEFRDDWEPTPTDYVAAGLTIA
ncbi:MAG: hypothetical protein R2687_01555 [Candidatus Nanopelagicales bacterium]